MSALDEIIGKYGIGSWGKTLLSEIAEQELSALRSSIVELDTDLAQAISILRYYSAHNNINDGEIDKLLDKYIEEVKK